MSAAQSYPNPIPADTYISAAAKALMAARDVKADELAGVIGSSRRAVFTKLSGGSPWKAGEVQALADYFDVPIADLFAGLGLLGNDEAPRPGGRRASTVGAPSGIRTPDPLIKSQLL